MAVVEVDTWHRKWKYYYRRSKPTTHLGIEQILYARIVVFACPLHLTLGEQPKPPQTVERWHNDSDTGNDTFHDYFVSFKKLLAATNEPAPAEQLLTQQI